MLAGRYLLPRDQLLQVEDEDADDVIQYRLDVLVLFIKYRASTQSLYVKKVPVPYELENKDLSKRMLFSMELGPPPLLAHIGEVSTCHTEKKATK